jgi:hypothetical protein
MHNFTGPKHGRLFATIVVSVIVIAGLAYIFGFPAPGPTIKGPRYSVVVYTTTLSEGFANTTIVGQCVPLVETQDGSETVAYSTCDWFAAWNVNVRCTGCSFNGVVDRKEVSGTGNKSFFVSSGDSWPYSFTWRISKNTSAGTLEVSVGGDPALSYDRNTTAPYGTISGGWGYAVALVTGNVTTIT